MKKSILWTAVLIAVTTAFSVGHPFVEELEARTFFYFWEVASQTNGLMPDRSPTPSPSSVAAVGFALTAYPIGVYRGYISRAEGADRVLTTLRFLAGTKEGEEFEGTSGYKGFFYHFLDMKDGARAWESELSSIDTALLMGGVLFCQSFFDQENKSEAEIRSLAETLYERVDWKWMSVHGGTIAHGWMPEEGFSPYDWRGYNEAMLLYVLALGSPTHPVDGNAWDAWSSAYRKDPRKLAYPSLFVHQYSHIWIDFRGIRDASGFDYFENSRRAAYAHQAYAIENPLHWKGYGKDMWGFTACDGPGMGETRINGSIHRIRSYFARGADASLDDGTIAPTAAIASIAFAPEIAIPATEEMYRRYGKAIYGKYGFVDAFNPSVTGGHSSLRHGKIVPGIGWVDTDHIGIDQGPILAMIENHRSGLIWNVMRKNPHIKQGLIRAGFTGGWLENPS